MRLPQALKSGDTLFLNDGLIQLETLKIEGEEIHCRVVIGGELRSHKGLNLPGINLGIRAFTERDREWLKFASERGVDAISQSFVESAADASPFGKPRRRWGTTHTSSQRSNVRGLWQTWMAFLR